MTVLATAQWGGVALFLVPLPIAIVVLILGARRERADTFLLLLLSITLLPAFWATALRAGFGPCNGCLHGTEKNLMLLAFPTLPLLVGAIVLLFLGRMQLGAIVIVVAQV